MKGYVPFLLSRLRYSLFMLRQSKAPKNPCTDFFPLALFFSFPPLHLASALLLPLYRRSFQEIDILFALHIPARKFRSYVITEQDKQTVGHA
jgi:hypothetical protein